jgi:hypothetical protein
VSRAGQRETILSVFAVLRDAVAEAVPSGPDFGRERALVLTKLDEAELWLTRCATLDER